MPPPALVPPKPPAVSGFRVSAQPQIYRAEFEGGYSQRSRKGPGNVARRGTLSWVNLSAAERDALLGFLEARGGSEAFTYQLPGHGAAQLWTAPGWSYAPSRSGLKWDVSADLTEEKDIL